MKKKKKLVLPGDTESPETVGGGRKREKKKSEGKNVTSTNHVW
jgi:hypothetical protein